MPTLNKKFLIPSGVGLLLLISISLIINSCKKNAKDGADAHLEASVLQARSWYENVYPSNAKGAIATQAVGANGLVNFNKLISPDWINAVTYNRLDKDVIEIPIDPSAKFGTGLKDNTTGRMLYKKERTRSSFLLLKDGTAYKAYIMTIMADSDYVKDDLSKLARNTYRKRDADFSGVVLYFTPEGKLVNGWRYRNGQLITSKTSTANSQNIQNTGGTKLKTNTDNIEAWECTNYYLITSVGDEIVNIEYLYSDCTPVYGIAGGGGGDGDGGGPGNNVPPPDPCGTINGGNPTPPGLNSAHQLKINTAPIPINPGGGGDGGFPPPAPPNPNLCTTPPTQQDITNNVKDSCIHNMVDSVLSKNVKGNIDAMIQGVFGDNNGSLDLMFSDQFAMLRASDDGEDVPKFINDDPTQGLINTSIHLNASTLSSSSQEYIAATIIHEALHSYLDSKGIDVGDDQHTVMAANYVTTMANDLIRMFKGLTKDAAYSLAWAGLEGTYSYSHPGDTYFPQYQSDINILYRAHTDGQGRFFGHGCSK